MNPYIVYILTHILKLKSYIILKDEPNRYVIRSDDVKVTMHKLEDLTRIDDTSDHSLTLILNAYSSPLQLIKQQKTFISYFFKVMYDWNKHSFTPKRLESFTYKGWLINVYEWIDGYHIDHLSCETYYQLLEMNRYFLHKYNCYICGLDNVLIDKMGKVYFIDDDSIIPIVNTTFIPMLSNIFIHDDPDGKHILTIFHHNKALIDKDFYELANAFKYKLLEETCHRQKSYTSLQNAILHADTVTKKTKEKNMEIKL